MGRAIELTQGKKSLRHAVLGIEIFVAIKRYQVMSKLLWENVKTLFQIETPHGFGEIRVDARSLLPFSIDLGDIIQISDGELSSQVESPDTVTSVKFEYPGLGWNITKVETGSSGPETCSQGQTGNAPILQSRRRGQVAGVFKEPLLSSTSKSFIGGKLRRRSAYSSPTPCN